MRGKFVVIEGIDGAGKTTLAGRVVAELRERDIATVATREPWSRRWRKAVCEGDVWASTADRAAHLTRHVWPALEPTAWRDAEGTLFEEPGDVVICDRHYLSCAAYAPRGYDRAEVLAQQRRLFGHPDLWVWLDTPPGTCQQRIAERGGERVPAIEELRELERRFDLLWPLVEGERLRVCGDDAWEMVLKRVLAMVEE